MRLPLREVPDGCRNSPPPDGRVLRGAARVAHARGRCCSGRLPARAARSGPRPLPGAGREPAQAGGCDRRAEPGRLHRLHAAARRVPHLLRRPPSRRHAPRQIQQPWPGAELDPALGPAAVRHAAARRRRGRHVPGRARRVGHRHPRRPRLRAHHCGDAGRRAPPDPGGDRRRGRSRPLPGRDLQLAALGKPTRIPAGPAFGRSSRLLCYALMAFLVAIAFFPAISVPLSQHAGSLAIFLVFLCVLLVGLSLLQSASARHGIPFVLLLIVWSSSSGPCSMPATCIASPWSIGPRTSRLSPRSAIASWSGSARARTGTYSRASPIPSISSRPRPAASMRRSSRPRFSPASRISARASPSTSSPSAACPAAASAPPCSQPSPRRRRRTRRGSPASSISLPSPRQGPWRSGSTGCSTAISLPRSWRARCLPTSPSTSCP